jgi:hypothetical protein
LNFFNIHPNIKKYRILLLTAYCEKFRIKLSVVDGREKFGYGLGRGFVY